MDNPLDFSGKTVLVVGGTTGIGNGIARAFRDRGADVFVWGTRTGIDEYADEDGDMSGMTYTQMDATDETAVSGWIAPFDRLDVLVCSQGLALYERKEFEIANFRKVIDVNLEANMICATRFRQQLAQTGGSIVFVNSVGAFRPTRGNPAYAASKAGLLGLTRVLAQAWARDGIRVNAVAPGLVETRLTKVTTDNPERLAERIKGIPAGRLGTVDDMAGAALYLASPLAHYVYGQTIVVDGGRML
ncbi:SDR family oxidoreductase [Croceicoccus ponticola]|uniref:SDR family oxidoreductase n=1 Tax=Croceicoccus ponticola TaxID=2217664 RepID=A0A437GWX4_9SPHN|nr:SDR family oxidoreductase [Croceicoccus ponticola]RVQ66599.1 SDR family oxidoreductase [Croceicoccus ponticola]